MITQANVTANLPVDRLASPATSAPGTATFILGPADLLEYARCPGRLRARTEPVDVSLTTHAAALRCLHLQAELFASRFRVHPATYELTVYRCPICGSASASASCSKCGCRRRASNEDRPWNANATTCRAWLAIAERDHVQVISADTLADVQHAQDRLQDLDDVADLRRGNTGPAYLSFTWEDPSSSIQVPFLITVDYAPDVDGLWGRALGAFRVILDASISTWSRSSFYRGDHVIAALPLDAWNAALDEDRNRFLYVLSESSAPHEPGRREIAPDLMTVGRLAYQRLLTQYCASLAQPSWPGYDDTTCIDNRWTPLGVEPWMNTDSRSLFGPPTLPTQTQATHAPTQ